MSASPAETIQTKRTTLAQLQQQSEKFDELALLNNELSTLKSQLENNRLREKRSCVTGGNSIRQ